MVTAQAFGQNAADGENRVDPARLRTEPQPRLNAELERSELGALPSEEVVVTADDCEVITEFPAEDLLITGRKYWTADGSPDTLRESRSHCNTAAGRGETREAGGGGAACGSGEVTMRVGFAGLGHMGLPMATRLAAHGFPLTVWNRTGSRAAPLAERGVPVAGSPRELAAASDVIITMLADRGAVHAIWCGPDGLLAGCGDGCVGVDMSTIGPHAAREIAAEAGRHGVEFLDAPVSGSTALAEQGTLTTMVGGPVAAFERVRPVLAALTARQLHLGPSGAGAGMKLAVNIMIAATNQAVAEALALAGEAGISPDNAYDTLTASAVASPFLGYKREAYLAAGGSPVSFTTALMAKDLELALGIATGAGLPLPVTTAARRFLDQACAEGFADADFACVASLVRGGRAENPT
jgi:3-hydroxyisobutyrate dehydrogenase-like beta-hydroxyacid dehydrogenase